jgi:enoyl-CoA hydratase/carnithine racemase
VVGAGAASLPDALAEERRAVLRCAGTRDQQEGFAAFLAKRKPVFAGG